jgi:hypothetical protein
MTARAPWDDQLDAEQPDAGEDSRREVTTAERPRTPLAKGEVANQALARFREEYERRLAEVREADRR